MRTQPQDPDALRGKAGRRDPVWLTWIDHTADAGIIVRAPTRRLLYARAAWAMFTLLVDPRTAVPREFVDVAVEAPDPGALMIRWLSELNYLFCARHMVFSRFDVLHVDQRRLQARAGGEPIDPVRHAVGTEIKAVTYHALDVRRVGRAWRATVVFDL